MSILMMEKTCRTARQNKSLRINIQYKLDCSGHKGTEKYHIPQAIMTKMAFYEKNSYF